MKGRSATDPLEPTDDLFGSGEDIEFFPDCLAGFDLQHIQIRRRIEVLREQHRLQQDIGEIYDA